MTGATSRRRRTATAARVLLAVGALVGTVVASGAGPAGATSPPAGFLQPELIAKGGFRSGPALEIGLSVTDVAWDAVNARLLVADCRAVRAVDPAAGTSTVLAVSDDQPNPDGVATFPGAVSRVAATPTGAVLLGVHAPTEHCTDLYFDDIVQLEPGLPAVVVSGGDLAPATGLDAHDVEWDAADLEVGADGRVLVTEQTYEHDAVYAFPVTGGTVTRVVGGGTQAIGAGVTAVDADFPLAIWAVAAAPDGTLFVMDRSTMYRVGADGLLDEVAGGLVWQNLLPALTVGPDGDVWRSTGGSVERIDPVDGTVTQVADVDDLGSAYFATIAVGPDHTAYVTDEVGANTDGVPVNVVAVSGAGTVRVAGNGSRWQGDGVDAHRQQLNLQWCEGFSCVLGGLPSVTNGTGTMRYLTAYARPNVASFDPVDGTTRTVVAGDSMVGTFHVGGRPGGDLVLLRLADSSSWDLGLELVAFDPVDQTTDVLLALPSYYPVVADVAPDGTTFVADQASDLLRSVAPDGTVSSAPLGLGTQPLERIFATASGVYVTAGDGLSRRVGLGWEQVDDCATGNQIFRPRIAAQDGTFLGTASTDDPPSDEPVSSWRTWCRIAPIDGTVQELDTPVAADGLLPTYAEEGTDGDVYYSGYVDGEPHAWLYRMSVSSVATGELTLHAAFLPGDDPHEVQLLVDGAPVGGPLGHRGMIDPLALAAGTHTITVEGAGDTDLSRYIPIFWGDCAVDGTVVVPEGGGVSCAALLFHRSVGAPSVVVGDVAIGRPRTAVGHAVFPVTIEGPAFFPVTVGYETADGSATAAGGDYSPVAGTLTFPAGGPATQYVSVPIPPTDHRAPTEQLALQLTSVSGAVIGDGSAIGTLVDRRGPIVASIGDATVVRSASGTRTASIPVRLSNAPSVGEEVTVSVATVDGTATAPTDYAAVSATVTFTAGERQKVVPVTVAASSVATPTRAFALDIESTGPNAVVGDPSAVVTLRSAGTPAPLPTLAIGDGVSLRQVAGGAATFLVTLSASAPTPVTVEYATEDGSVAVAGQDYEARSGTLTFAPGETSKVITVPVLPGRRHVELETMRVVLRTPSGATLADDVGIGRLLNQRPFRLPVSISNVTAVRSSSVASTATIVLAIPEAASAADAASVTVTTIDGTAVAGVDHTAVTTTVSFAPGQRTASLTVPVLPMADGTPSRSFTVSVHSPTANVAIGDPSATVTLVGP